MMGISCNPVACNPGTIRNANQEEAGGLRSLDYKPLRSGPAKRIQGAAFKPESDIPIAATTKVRVAARITWPDNA